MKSATLRTSLLVLMCGLAGVAQGALRPEGDKIEFSPPREELKVAPLTGSDAESPQFNFQRREPGGSVSDVPSAVALPAPDQVNRMRALQELIERRSSWARPADGDDDFGDDLTGSARGSETELGIDDLFDRQSGRMDRGLNRFRDSDSSALERGMEGEMDRSTRDRRGLNNRDPRDRGRESNLDGRTDSLTNEGEIGGERSDTLPGQRDGVGTARNPAFGGHREPSDGFLEFGSLVPKSGEFLRDSNRDLPTREDRMDSLRRILGTSAPTILGTGTSGGRPGGADSMFGIAAPGGFGTSPGANRNLSQSLDSRFGPSVTTPAMENLSGNDRLTSAPNRPFDLDLTTGREGFGSGSERLQVAPPPTPMELFRQKHSARIPTRAF